LASKKEIDEAKKLAEEQGMNVEELEKEHKAHRKRMKKLDSQLQASRSLVIEEKETEVK